MTATDALLREPAIQAVGWALLHFVWQGTLIGAAAAIALRLLRQSAADVRYVVASIAMVLMATLPVVTGVQTWKAARAESPVVVRAEAGTPSVSTVVAVATTAAAGVESAATPCSDCTASVAPWAGFERWMPTVVLGWMAGVAILALRLAGGWFAVRRMRTHGATPADARLQAIVRRLARTLHLSRPVVLLQSASIDVPTVIGWLKPVVLLPMGALAGLSPLQLEAILAHELAHIRRHDYLVNLLQSLVETLLFYHPAVWWLSRRIRIEREHCCDDLAVSLCGDPVVYARALAELEELRSDGPQLAMAANGGLLLSRIRRLLSGPAAHAGRGPAWLAAATAMLLMAGILAGPVGRQSVAAASVVRPEASRHGSLRDIIDVIAGFAGWDQWPAPPAPPAPPVPPAPSVAPTPPPPPPPPAPMTPESAATPPVPGSPVAPPAPLAPLPPAPGTAPLPPLPPVPPAVEQERKRESSGTYSHSNDGEKLSVSYRGSFTLNDTDTDIVSLSPNSYVKISDSGRQGSHTLELTADGSGNITRRFRVGGSERPFEPEGRQWLAAFLPRFVRQSGFNAKERVARFLKKGGADAVLAEIALIDSDYGKKVYFTQLIDQAPLDAAASRRLFEQAGREIDSDYEMASTLIAGARLLTAEPVRQAYFGAAKGIDSDYEMRRAYSAALERGPVSPELTADILDGARSLESDYEAATLLIDILKQHAIEGAPRAAFFRTLATVESSYEKGRVLQELLRRKNLSAETLAMAVDAAATVGSDYETAQVLVAAAASHEITGSTRDAFVRAAERLGEYERNRALAALARAGR
jgi:beta-lactamase regulating signal transducer with metallopeptidase domain